MVVANFIFHICPQQDLPCNMLFLWNLSLALFSRCGVSILCHGTWAGLWLSRLWFLRPVMEDDTSSARFSRTTLLERRHTYGKAHEGVPDDSPTWGPSWQPASDMWVNEALAGESPVILSPLHSLHVFLAEKNYCALSESLTHKICDH